MEFENNQVTQDNSMDRMAAMSRTKTLTPINDIVVPDAQSDNQLIVTHETSGAIANVDTDTESTLKDSPETFAPKASGTSLALPAFLIIAAVAVVAGVTLFIFID
jgi:hypothetical protein